MTIDADIRCNSFKVHQERKTKDQALLGLDDCYLSLIRYDAKDPLLGCELDNNQRLDHCWFID